MEPLDTLSAALKRVGISDGKRLKVRSSKYYLVNVEGCCSDTPCWDQPEQNEMKELMGNSANPLKTQDSDLILIRAADNPYNNKFLYIAETDKGPQLKMGYVNPYEGGAGLFRRREQMDETVMNFVYTYTNVAFDKCIGVKPSLHPHIELMEPSTLPVTVSDPRVFFKQPARGHSFLLQSGIAHDLYVTFNNTEDDVTLSKTGSPLVERDGTSVDEVDCLCELSTFSESASRDSPPVLPIVAEYSAY